MTKLYTILFILCSPIYGYLDPGTGSMLLYFLMGVFATLFFTLKEFFYKVKNFFIILRGGRIKVEDDLDIVFYSEGGKYWNVFEPILRELKNTDIKCGYFTSDKTDKGLEYQFPNISTKYIGNETVSLFTLNNLKANIVVMTTPQLDVLTLKRSKNVKYYCHLIHAPTDALIYGKFAFDYFDCVMCSGNHQIKSIRALERKRKLPPKLLLKTGLTYYDMMMENKLSFEKNTTIKTILVAPTWGNNGMIYKYGSKILLTLAKSNMNIIFRPHPQLYIDVPKDMENIENELAGFSNLYIDKSSSGDKSMSKADLLISDISGIIFDFAFIHQKPIIVLKSDMLTGGLEAEDVAHKVWEFGMLSELAYILEDSDDIMEIIKSTLDVNEKKDFEKIKSASLFNFSKAGKVGAKQLKELLLEHK